MRVNSIVFPFRGGQNGEMRTSLISAFVATTVLSACFPLAIYYKPGVGVATMQRDQTNCEVGAVNKVPVNTQIRREPARYIPGQRRCDAAGNCNMSRGYYIPGEVYTVDVNKGLRKRAAMQCMADRGYAPVDIPPCSDAIARSTPAAATRILPRLGPNACVIRNKGGTWQIVNPG